MSVRGVLFDLDDTLTDRHRSIERFAPRFQDQFRDALQPVDVKQIVRCMVDADANGYAPRRHLAAHLRSSLNWRTAPQIEQLMTFWHENFARCAVEREGVTAALEALGGAGLKLGVVTNGRASQHVKLEALGIGPLLSVVIVSDEIGCKKPDLAIFRAALQQLGTSASETIFVGDNPDLDVAGARAAGMRPIWLCNGRDWPADAGPPPDCITAFEQLPRLCGIG
jgi:putative hydrolase of the HAD superfamily